MSGNPVVEGIKKFALFRRNTMNHETNEPWNQLTHQEKNHELYLKQKLLLEQFLSTGAISQAQPDV